MTTANYSQILILTALTALIIGIEGLLSFFIYLALFEFCRRSLFKRDIPCPHCGFDASWYKRDVKVARSRVEDFWNESNPNIAVASSKEPQQERLESALNS